MLRHGYHLLQKVSVFLVVLIAGFTYLTVSVDAVNRAVVGWLTEVYQTHTHLSIGLEDSSVDLSKVQVNWVPAKTTLDTSLSEEGYFSILYNNQSVGSIALYNNDTNMSVNTEDAIVTELDSPKFDKIVLVERLDGIAAIATNNNVLITISVIKNMGYDFTTGEVLNILQNINY